MSITNTLLQQLQSYMQIYPRQIFVNTSHSSNHTAENKVGINYAFIYYFILKEILVTLSSMTVVIVIKLNLGRLHFWSK